MPSSRPTPETVMAILGSDSLLQASLRVRLLISQAIGPVAGWRWTGPRAPVLTPGAAVPFAEPTGACVVTATPRAAPCGTPVRSRAVAMAAGTTESGDSADGIGPPLSASMPARLRRALGGTRGLQARLNWMF